MKTRIAALIGLVVVLVLVVGIGGYWYVKDHQRIGQSSLQSKVVSKTGGTAATCVKKDSNAAHWLCAVTVSKSPERCVKAHVRPWGSVSVVNGFRKCLADPALKALFVTSQKTKKKKKSGSSA